MSSRHHVACVVTLHVITSSHHIRNHVMTASYNETADGTVCASNIIEERYGDRTIFALNSLEHPGMGFKDQGL
jgi:hypothetical protein